MYLPPDFREDNLETLHAFIHKYPLGLLITAGLHGLAADWIPFVLDEQAGELGTLRAHLSRANPQYRALAETDECLVVFQGPEAYISPSWYPTKQETGRVVPTWNYVTVHAWGRPQIIEDQAWIRDQIEVLTNSMESHRQQPWSVADAPEPFIQSQLKGIFGMELAIVRMEGKWKASQNRTANDRRGVVEGLRLAGSGAMADVVEQQ